MKYQPHSIGLSSRRERRNMPLFSYVVVIGSILLALMFVADATLEKSERLPNNSQFAGLPKPWDPKTQNFASNFAQEPGMTSDAVKAAAPLVVAPTNSAAAKPTVKPHAKKIARRHPLPGEAGQRYAWRPDDSAAFRGSAVPWRF
jgi:hypothetical protein